jgi:hypothetical protein
VISYVVLGTVIWIRLKTNFSAVFAHNRSSCDPLVMLISVVAVYQNYLVSLLAKLTDLSSKWVNVICLFLKLVSVTCLFS